MDSSNSKVSLLIPCYNNFDTLPALLNDAVSQSRPFDEIIVFDDGSTDNTVESVNQFKCQVIRSIENRGAGYARQQLLKAATSTYIHFHDADDRMEVGFLETLLPYCQKDVAVCCALKEVKRDGTTSINKHQSLNNCDDLIAYMIRNFVHLDTVIYPKEAAISAGGFDIELRTNQDRVFHYKLAAFNLKFKYIDKSLVTQIRNPNSATFNNNSTAIITNYVRGAEVALDIFPSYYHHLLADYLLFCAEKAISINDYPLADYVINLAKYCGAKKLKSKELLINILSQILGIYNALTIRNKYIKCRQNLRLGN